jgi:Family of unknown function (DUF6428)
MKLSEFKQNLKTVTEVAFLKPEGKSIPKHFHITEVGQIDKRFMDCGGTVRSEKVISMQFWESVDFWHRLEPSKLHKIIELAEKKLDIGDHEIEIEYQAETIAKYGVEFENGIFKFTTKTTACLATENCVLPTLKNIKEKVEACCTPSGGCC